MAIFIYANRAANRGPCIFRGYTSGMESATHAENSNWCGHQQQLLWRHLNTFLLSTAYWLWNASSVLL